MISAMAENEDPTQAVCQCGDDMNRYCSLCTDARRERVINRRQDRLYKGMRGIPKVIREPEVIQGKTSNKQRKIQKQRMHRVKIALQHELGHKLTNKEFEQYLAIRAAKLKEQHANVMQHGVTDRPSDGQLKINQAINKTLHDQERKAD
jgi:hypothetical protein